MIYATVSPISMFGAVTSPRGIFSTATEVITIPSTISGQLYDTITGALLFDSITGAAITI